MAQSEGCEIFTVVRAVMLADMPYIGLRDAIFTHSTVAEGFVFLCGNVPPPTAQRTI
jgi:hypothetical protein